MHDAYMEDYESEHNSLVSFNIQTGKSQKG